MFSIRPKHFFIYTLLSTLALASLWSCRKDVEIFRAHPPTIDDVQQLSQQAHSTASKTVFSLNQVQADTMLATPGGVRIFLTDTENLFADAGGDPVPCSTCQTLRVEVTEALDKSDIIAYAVPTTTIDGRLLESGGMVRITASCDGEALQLLPGRKMKIQIPAQQPEADMQVFSGTFDDTDFLGWQNTDLPVFQAEWVVPGPGTTEFGYELFSPYLDWINCDRFYHEQSSSFCVEMPASFNSGNTQAYIVFKNQRTVAVLQHDPASRKFCVPDAPSGYQVRLVTLSKTADGQFWLGNYETEIGTDATVQITPQQVSEQQMLDFLKSL